jgi:hypothetical protein
MWLDSLKFIKYKLITTIIFFWKELWRVKCQLGLSFWEKSNWLVAGGWFVLIEKYCWLVAYKPSEQGELEQLLHTQLNIRVQKEYVLNCKHKTQGEEKRKQQRKWMYNSLIRSDEARNKV